MEDTAAAAAAGDDDVGQRCSKAAVCRSLSARVATDLRLPRRTLSRGAVRSEFLARIEARSPAGSTLDGCFISR